MATNNGGDEESVFYAFFSCKCKGIKFNDLREAGLEFWQHVTLKCGWLATTGPGIA